MRRGRTVLNRTTLGLTGLLLLVAGAWLSLTQASWAPRLPGWWPTPGPHTSLVDAGHLATAREQGWWIPVVTAAAVVAALLFALWTVRQLSSGTSRHVPLPVPRSVLRTRALESAMTGHAVAVNGVRHCRTRVRVRPGHLDVALRVRLRDDMAPAAVLPALAQLAADTEAALTPYRFQMHIRFTTRPHRRPHVR